MICQAAKPNLLFIFFAGLTNRLPDKKIMGTQENDLAGPMTPGNTTVLDGEPAWRQHDGMHTDAPNWPVFLQWADKYVFPTNAPTSR